MKFKFLIVSVLLITLAASCNQSNSDQNAGIEYYEDGDAEQLLYHGTDAVEIIFIGEGYSEGDLEKDIGTYHTEARKDMDIIFSYSPFSEYKAHFNFTIIYAKADENNDTFDIVYDDQNNLYDWNYELFESYIRTHFPKYEREDPKYLVLFSFKEKPVGMGSPGLAFYTRGEEYVLIHEIGHAFGNLLDEYEFEYNLGKAHPYDISILAEKTPNVSFAKDTARVPWRHFIGLEGYEDIGIYEGAMRYPKNIWRPTKNSIMRNSLSYFNAPSRESMVKQIYEVKGWKYNFEAFLETDRPIQKRLVGGRVRKIQELNCKYDVLKSN